jgi:hypothetical protein
MTEQGQVGKKLGIGASTKGMGVMARIGITFALVISWCDQ